MGKTTKNTIVFLFLPFIFFSQVKEKENLYYNWFDQVVGQEHTGLYNGKQYVNLDVNRIYKGKHSFFLSDDAVTGSISYDGQVYYNVDMKYNLETDNVLVALKPGAVASILELIRDKVDRFTIEDYSFIRIDGFEENNTLVNGFHQVLLENTSYSLLKRHKKIRRKKIGNVGDNKLYFEFVSKNAYVLFADGHYRRIKSKGDIMKMYPALKKVINQFYIKNKTLKKSNPDGFMQRLFKNIIKESSPLKVV
ncbi:hypothetical protein [uncultured Aquimarina sp.]|uniref:hypothetical protein n=1 Tax=uncultured Aquimarina sp. TaxID=575652 RepID=UPI0026327A0E|nr:hypothetical protein [uncultured Aquimarina sp.]